MGHVGREAKLAPVVLFMLINSLCPWRGWRFGGFPTFLASCVRCRMSFTGALALSLFLAKIKVLIGASCYIERIIGSHCETMSLTRRHFFASRLQAATTFCRPVRTTARIPLFSSRALPKTEVS